MIYCGKYDCWDQSGFCGSHVDYFALWWDGSGSGGIRVMVVVVGGGSCGGTGGLVVVVGVVVRVVLDVVAVIFRSNVGACGTEVCIGGCDSRWW